MTTARDMREAIKREADKLGVGVTFGYGGKHPFAILDDGHSKRRVTFSGTPSDFHAVNNVVRDVRDMVEDMRKLRQRVPLIAPSIVPVIERPVQPWEVAPVIVEPAPDKPFLYHFTSSAHLPYIIQDGLAVFTPNGVRDLLWATNNGDSERVATDKFKVRGFDPYRDGAIVRVRIGLHYDDFKPWREVAEAEPGWSAARIEAVERSARERGQNTSGWFARREPLPISRFIGIDTRSYRSHKWEPFTKGKTIFMAPDPSVGGSENVQGVEIGDKVYFSTRKWADGEHDIFDLLQPVEADKLLATMVRSDDAENAKRDLLLGNVLRVTA